MKTNNCQKIKLLKLYELLQQQTDEMHPLKTVEIIDKLRQHALYWLIPNKPDVPPLKWERLVFVLQKVMVKKIAPLSRKSTIKRKQN